MDVLELMKERLRDAEEDAERLRNAIRLLEQDGNSKPVGKRPRRQKVAAETTAKVVPLGKLLKLLRESPGVTNSQLAKQTGGDQSKLLALLKEAEADGKVRREGQRRATRWFPADSPVAS